MTDEKLSRVGREIKFDMYDTKYKMDKNSARLLILSAFEGIILKNIGCCSSEMMFYVIPNLREIEITFETHLLDNFDLDFLQDFNSTDYRDPTDGSPRFETSIRANKSKEGMLEDNAWMQTRDEEMDEWKKIQDYKYNGNFTVSITIKFSKGDWEKYAEIVKEVEE